MRHSLKGFTFIEALIYTVFVSMMMTSMVLLAHTAFTVRSKLRASLILEANTRFALTRITALVADASSITTPSSGNTSSTLVFATSVTSTNPTTITATNGILYLTQGTSTAQALTSNEISVTSLSFVRVSSTAPLVRVLFSASLANAGSSYASISVTSSAAARR